MSGQSLIFCVGAHKSGTSWLHGYLRRHGACYFRNLKELHYFDTLDSGGSNWHQARQTKRLAGLHEKLANHPKAERNEWLPVLITDIEDWVAQFDGFHVDDAAYLDYIGFGRAESQVVGDITPAYGQVSADMLAHMAALGEDVKFIFLMRDPVERLWSHLRMISDLNGDEALEQAVSEYLDDQHSSLTAMSDYQGTLERLLAVVPRARVHIELFERLFSQEALGRLCRFLGIESVPGEVERVVHKGRKIALPDILRTRFEEKLAPQYQFVEEFMGGLPPEWTEKMVNA